MRLFCFPHAGGSALSFRGWEDAFPRHVEICAVQPPGRDGRRGEPPARRLAELVETIALAVRPLLDRPFALFGHSLGAKLAFELAHRLEAGDAGPAHLFVSASPAPHLPDEAGPLHVLPDGELIERLRAFGGTPPEILNNAELLAWVLPVIRADFELSETYRYPPGLALQCGITAFGGSEDAEVSPGALEAWRRHTAGRFRRRMFDGGHFFFQERRDAVIHEISRDLNLFW